jgi:hypothetical protein
MLSFSRGRPIALVKGGKHNGKSVRMYMDDIYGAKPDMNADPTDYLTFGFIMKKLKKNKKLSVLDMNKIKKALKDNLDIDGELGGVLQEAKETMNKKNKKEFILHDGQLVPHPNPQKTERLYICGPSDSGKSTYTSFFIKEYKKMFPKKRIIIFSDVGKDEVLDDLKPIRVTINKELVTEPIEPEELKNSLVLFDDVDSISDKKISRAVLNLRNSMLKRGRHEGVTTICTAHIMANGNETKTILNECSAITIFPKSGVNCDYVLKRYCNLNKDQIAKIYTLPSRWVTINKTYPMYVIYQTGAYLL